MTSQVASNRRPSSDHFTVAIIGHTGRGNYGHSLDRAFEGVQGTRVIAVADPDQTGRERVRALTGAPVGYADYREMLARERPDITVIASREIGDHLQIVMDVASHRSHVYLEKPVAAFPAEVDDMIHACEAHNLQLVVAHPWRGHPPIQRVAIPAIRAGRIGEPRLARIYGMGGRHGGNELFIDLAPHFFDFLWQLFGMPSWCQAHITQDGRTSTPEDLRQGGEGMGLVAGNGMTTYYQWDTFAAHFESYKGDGREIPYRIDIHGTEGTLSIPGPMSNEPDVWVHPLVNPPVRGDDRWEVIPSDPPPADDKWVRAHHRMAASMVARLRGETPEWDLVDGHQARRCLEMALLAHESHISGARVAPPLARGCNPFDEWR
ncbi:MAG: Gfo/Idh/MocA family oxidoreductase [Chloroflexi bacterium]|nr:Gfo/Idh/MocA family oxidoreductase [Chloroflexota bacterium]